MNSYTQITLELDTSTNSLCSESQLSTCAFTLLPPTHRHLPGGVLYDLYGPRPTPHAYDSSSSSDSEEEEEDGKGKGGGGRRRRRPRPQCAAEEDEGGGGGGGGRAPWRITVRFHDIPLDQASVCICYKL